MRKLNGEECLIVTDFENRKYFSGIDIDEGILVISNEKAYFSDARYFTALKEKLFGSEIKALLLRDGALKDYLAKKQIDTAYVDFNKTTVKEYNALAEYLTVKDAGEIIAECRSVKSEEEIENIKKACEIAQNAFYKTIKHIRLGVSEAEIKDILETEMIKMGASGTSFDTIIAFGKNAGVPHHKTCEDKLKENSVVLMDFGCKVNGYCSDITRTLYFGKPNKEFIKNYNAVLYANELAIKTVKAGMTGKDADGIAREYLKSQNLSEYFTHSLGHGVGLEIHENPYLSPKSQEIIKDGAVFTIEPGVYFDTYGIRIEDTVIIKDGKAERLFTDDKKLLIIGR